MFLIVCLLFSYFFFYSFLLFWFLYFLLFLLFFFFFFFFFQAEDGIRDGRVTGVQTCALPISGSSCRPRSPSMAAMSSSMGGICMPAASMADGRAAYPGPKARAIIERMRRVEGAGPRTGAGEPLVVDQASGATLIDPDGNRYTDLAGSFAAATIGHSHPDVVAAVGAQIGTASHVSTAAVSEQRVGFEEDLLAIVPNALDRVLLGISGADANDIAVRLARSLTGRREVLAFSGGYFGRAGGVVGLNGKAAFRSRVGIDVDAHFLPYPDPYRWSDALGGSAAAGGAALDLVRQA